ncbi:hypothetical protein VNI00_010043 [Paramarasmius palmivorus]|uniref:Uncharacterized protein n=1 Tax=Paramarasmius palmivorus TaxID=297713 RepID=A0AAW0CKN8_9AGAR
MSSKARTVGPKLFNAFLSLYHHVHRSYLNLRTNSEEAMVPIHILVPFLFERSPATNLPAYQGPSSTSCQKMVPGYTWPAYLERKDGISGLRWRAVEVEPTIRCQTRGTISPTAGGHPYIGWDKVGDMTTKTVFTELTPWQNYHGNQSTFGSCIYLEQQHCSTKRDEYDSHVFALFDFLRAPARSTPLSEPNTHLAFLSQSKGLGSSLHMVY